MSETARARLRRGAYLLFGGYVAALALALLIRYTVPDVDPTPLVLIAAVYFVVALGAAYDVDNRRAVDVDSER